MRDAEQRGSQVERPVVIRTPGSPLAEPARFARELVTDLGRSGPLALEMAKRDVRGQYRQSAFGAAVVVLPPLVLTAIGVGFRDAGLLRVDEVAIPYALFVLCGITLWTTFLDALNAPIYGVLSEQRLLAMTGSAPEAILLAKLLQVLFNLAVKCVPLAAAMIWYGVPLPATALLAPLALAGLIALGTALGLLLAPINLIFGDVARILVAATTLWFFLTPIYFPAPDSGLLGTVMRLNPVTPLLEATRSAALLGTLEPSHWLFATLGALVLLPLTWVYLRVTLPAGLEQANG